MGVEYLGSNNKFIKKKIRQENKSEKKKINNWRKSNGKVGSNKGKKSQKTLRKGLETRD